jgi:hypothetical protein
MFHSGPQLFQDVLGVLGILPIGKAGLSSGKFGMTAY